MTEAVGWVLLLMAAVGAAYTLASGVAVEWFFCRPFSPDGEFPPVTLLTPLHGDEPELRANLARLCTQDYPAAVQIVFGCRDPLDPAIGVVERLKRDHPALDIEMVVDPRLYGSNYKISNLINMERRVRHPVLVMADSDVTVGPDYLRRLVAALARPGVGFATCVYTGRPTGNLWSRLAVLAMDYHLLPSVAFGLWIKKAEPCFGPTIALRKTTLEQIGGFHAFVDHLADDFEIGRAIRSLGYGFAIPPMVIGHGCPERSGRGLVSHELRWASTIRIIDPASYAGSVICHPLPWALLAVPLLHADLASLAGLGLVLLARLFVTWQVQRFTGANRHAWGLMIARDLLSAAVWVWSYTVRSVSWRGARFRLGRDGVLTPLQPRMRSPRLGLGPRPGWTRIGEAGLAPVTAGASVAKETDGLG